MIPDLSSGRHDSLSDWFQFGNIFPKDSPDQREDALPTIRSICHDDLYIGLTQPSSEWGPGALIDDDSLNAVERAHLEYPSLG